MSRKNIFPAVGLALLGGTALASADDYERSEHYEQRGPIPFEVLDLDGDHQLTAAPRQPVIQSGPLRRGRDAPGGRVARPGRIHIPGASRFS